MDLLEDEAAARREDANLIPDVLGHLFRARSGEYLPRVATAAQKVRSRPNSFFNSAAFMPEQVIWTGLMASRPASIR